ncbi:hypothetical protein ACTZI2_25130 (plasmid) [Escherichia coli]
MLILDCSSRTQALHTLSAGFGCSPEKLKKVLLSLDLERALLQIVGGDKLIIPFC